MCSQSSSNFWSTLVEGGASTLPCDFLDLRWLALSLLLVALVELLVLVLSSIGKILPEGICSLFSMQWQRKLTMIFSLCCSIFSLCVILLVLFRPEGILGTIGQTESITLFSITPTALQFLVGIIERVRWTLVLGIATILFVNIILIKTFWNNKALDLVSSIAGNSWAFVRAKITKENVKKIIGSVFVTAQVKASLIWTPRPHSGAALKILLYASDGNTAEWIMWEKRRIKSRKIVLSMSGSYMWVDREPRENETQGLVDFCHLRYLSSSGNHYYEITGTENPDNGEITAVPFNSASNWVKLNQKHVIRFPHVIFDVELVSDS